MLRVDLRAEVGVADPVEVRAIGECDGGVVPAEEHGAGRWCLIQRGEVEIAGAPVDHHRDANGAGGRRTAAGDQTVRAATVTGARGVVEEGLEVGNARGEAVVGREEVRDLGAAVRIRQQTTAAGIDEPGVTQFTSTTQGALSLHGQLSWLCCCERGGLRPRICPTSATTNDILGLSISGVFPL